MTDSPIVEAVEKIKPVTDKTVGVAVKPVMRLISGFHYDPNPTRTKIKLGAKWAIPSMILGMVIGYRRLRKGNS